MHSTHIVLPSATQLYTVSVEVDYTKSQWNTLKYVAVICNLTNYKRYKALVELEGHCYEWTNSWTHPLTPRERSADRILRIFASVFFLMKAEALIYLYIFHTAKKEYPVSDIPPPSPPRHSSLVSCVDLGRWQRHRSNMKHPKCWKREAHG